MSSTDCFKCPVRDTDGSLMPGSVRHATPDSFGNTDNRHYLTCNYCGSLDQNRFMDEVKAGALLIATDKDNKVYISSKNNRLGKTGEGLFRATFLFNHLSREQQWEFYQMYLKGQLNIAYPGRFAPLPYFFPKSFSSNHDPLGNLIG